MPSPELRARVARVDRGACDLLVTAPTAPAPNTPTVVRARIAAELLAAGRADPTATPCTGDWGLFAPGPEPELRALLPRSTAIMRGSVAPGSSHGHVLAANIDVAAVVEPLWPGPDLARLERLLALAWSSGATPVVVLTKSDLAGDVDHQAEVASIAPGVEVLTVSTVTGQGVAELRARVLPGRTLAWVGPSGAGKSSLTNALLGTDAMAVQALRADGEGRHTTVHRQLHVLPGGGLLIDTPGLRSVGLSGDGDGVAHVFSDIEELALHCRFRDCGHATEPGCAVLAAVESGELERRRLDSWNKLQREAAWMARRQDARLQAQEVARWKSIHKEQRRNPARRPRR